ncbi:MAG: GNAT family N-acetyltransferase [Promethearchaeota archaeon]
MLIGKRIKLVALDSKNVPSFVKWFNDAEILQFLSNYRPVTQEGEEQWVKDMGNAKNTIVFSIVVIAEEKLIGNCSIDMDWRNRVGSMGIVIGEKDYHSKGYGTEAMNLAVQYGFEELNLNRMELEVYSHNPRAQKCYIEVGFKEEGRRRSAIFKNGKYNDAIVMGILKEEWKKNS